MEKLQHLKIPLENIVQATDNFDDRNAIGSGGFGTLYKGELSWSGSLITVAAKRLDHRRGQGTPEFLKEILMLSFYTHKNIISLVGFCDERNEKILVYTYESRGSLDRYLSSPDLTWIQRLKISIGAARGLNYLHDDVGPHHRVLHRDIKSSNILLNEDWEPKLTDFGLSKIAPAHVEHTFVVTNACGTFGYVDPDYIKTGILTKESDVYSFGVVLFEILCGRLALVNHFQDDRRFLSLLARRVYEQNKLDDIIDPNLRKQMKLDSLNIFSAIAYQCLNYNRSERPTMANVIEKLERALELQTSQKAAKIARVGIWGTKSSGGTKDRWRLLVGKDEKLKKITIEHSDVVNSLTFTSEDADGVLHTSNKAGGWNGGDKVSEVTFEDFEEIMGISGTVGLLGGYTIISSLSFVTNKRIHGPFGCASGTPFNVPWEKGTFGGFYGLAGNQIDSIGVYLKATV